MANGNEGWVVGTGVVVWFGWVIVGICIEVELELRREFAVLYVRINRSYSP